MKRLGIVVPYRDRAEHLHRFILHLSNYFTRDKVDHQIPYSVVIVEQEDGVLHYLTQHFSSVFPQGPGDLNRSDRPQRFPGCGKGAQVT